MSVCAHGCLCICVRVYGIVCTHVVQALFPRLHHSPSFQAQSEVSPCDGPGGVCFLSGPGLRNEGDRGATKVGTSALPDLLEASK